MILLLLLNLTVLLSWELLQKALLLSKIKMVIPPLKTDGITAQTGATNANTTADTLLGVTSLKDVSAGIATLEI